MAGGVGVAEVQRAYDVDLDFDAEVGALEDGERQVEPAPVDTGSLTHPLILDLLLEPANWQIWPAVAALRWMLRQRGKTTDVIYRCKPSLRFASSEIVDVALTGEGVVLTLEAPGIAGPGSLLPTSDIARIIEDDLTGGGLGRWLDGPTDRFMHAVEVAKGQYQAAFALATGGKIAALDSIASLVGRSAPLSSRGDGRLSDTWREEPEGAVGLAGLFVGPVSAAGLAELFQAFTRLPVEVRENAGAEVTVLHPATVGGTFNAMLGTTCRMDAAGIEVTLDGGDCPTNQAWAREPSRRRALYLLAQSYIGSSNPAVRIILRLERENVPPATLGEAAFGGLALLGEANEAVFLPLHDNHGATP